MKTFYNAMAAAKRAMKAPTNDVEAVATALLPTRIGVVVGVGPVAVAPFDP